MAMHASASIIIPVKRGLLAPTLQRGSKGGRSASRVPAAALIKAHASSRRREHGAVLIVGLVVLLVVSIFGVSAMQSSVLQERMAGNARQNNIALQAAEAALQAGLTFIEMQTIPPIPDSSGTDQVWNACKVDMPTTVATPDPAAAEGEGADPVAGGSGNACTRFADVLADWQANPTTASEGVAYPDISGITVNPIQGVIAQPRVYIESRHMEPEFHSRAFGMTTYYYTITAVGYGQTESAVAILQSTIAKRFGY